MTLAECATIDKHQRKNIYLHIAQLIDRYFAGQVEIAYQFLIGKNLNAPDLVYVIAECCVNVYGN